MKYPLKKEIAKGRRTKGFTIVESLVAIAILILSITGPMVIVAQSLKSAYFARDQITAFNLAQEAIEYIRNQRDTGILTASDPTTWLNSLTSGGCVVNAPISPNNSTCGLTRTSGYVLTPCNGTCQALNFDPNTGIFGSNVGAAGPFSRTIYLTSLPSDSSSTYEIMVKVVVNWTSSVGGNNAFILNDVLTNWGL